MARRTQAERSGATTARLVAVASRSFGRDGYAATSMETVAAAAGVTKGAAYHHFGDKAGLFRAVFAGQQAELAAALERSAAGAPDSWSALRRGCRTFLERCLDPEVRRISLLDGPSVLGWEAVREIQGRHTLRVLRAGLGAAAADGRVADGDLTARCRLVFGALCEAGMLLARSDRPAEALRAITGEVERLLEGLAHRRPG